MCNQNQNCDGKWKDDKTIYKEQIFHYNGNLKYDGYWKDGKRYGKGTEFNFAGDIVYCGMWEDDNYNGYGEYTYPDGRAYKGEWIEGRRLEEEIEGRRLEEEALANKRIWQGFQKLQACKMTCRRLSCN